MTVFAKAVGALTLTFPWGRPTSEPAASTAPDAALTMSRQNRTTCSPDSVTFTLRVDRSSSRVASASSRRLIWRLTVDGVLPSWRAANEKLPASTTLAKTAISGNKAKSSLGFIVPTGGGSEEKAQKRQPLD